MAPVRQKICVVEKSTKCSIILENKISCGLTIVCASSLRPSQVATPKEHAAETWSIKRFLYLRRAHQRTERSSYRRSGLPILGPDLPARTGRGIPAAQHRWRKVQVIRFQDRGLTFKMRTSSLFEMSKNSIYPLKTTLSIICLQLLYVLKLTAHLVIIFFRIGSDLFSTSFIFLQNNFQWVFLITKYTHIVWCLVWVPVHPPPLSPPLP